MAIAVTCAWLAIAGPGDPRAAASSPPVPRAAWRVELAGYMGVHLGPASRSALALFFTDQPAVYVHTKVTAVAVDPRGGAVVWKSSALPWGWGFASDADRLYSRTGTSVSAWDWKTGQRLWTEPAEPLEDNRLVARDGRVVWVAYSGDVVAADGATGRHLWSRGFAPRDAWTPMVIVQGNVYLSALGSGRRGLISAVIGLDLESGAIVRKDVFNPNAPGPYVFDYLRWSPRTRLFFGQDGVEGAGVHGRGVRVIRPDLSPVWAREGIRGCRAAGDVLVCETYPGGYHSTGLIALEMTTRRTVWQRNGRDDVDHQVVGEWNGTVVVMRRPGHAGSGRLMGLRPRDGRPAWSLTVPAAAARVYGDLLVAALEQQGRSAAAVAYRMP